MNVTAKTLHAIASGVRESKNKELNLQTEIWLKNYFLNILAEQANKGKFCWTGHILRSLATNTEKFESYAAPSTGLNFYLLQSELEQLGFSVTHEDSYFCVNWIGAKEDY